MISDLIHIIKRVYFKLTLTYEKTYISQSYKISLPNFNNKPQFVINYIRPQDGLLYIKYIKKKGTDFILYFLSNQIIDYRKFIMHKGLLEQLRMKSQRARLLKLITYNYEHRMYFKK